MKYVIISILFALVGCKTTSSVSQNTDVAGGNILTWDEACELGQKGRRALPRLARAILSDDSKSRRYAGFAMIAIGRESIPYVIEALKNPKNGIHKNAHMALRAMSKNGVISRNELFDILDQAHGNNPILSERIEYLKESILSDLEESELSKQAERSKASTPPSSGSTISGMATNVDFEELAPEEQALAVVYAEGVEKADSPPWPIGGWDSMVRKMNLPFSEDGKIDSGFVGYEFTLDEKGNVREVIIVESFSREIDKIVVRALRDTKFKPLIRGGNPKAVRLRNGLHIELPKPNKSVDTTPASAPR